MELSDLAGLVSNVRQKLRLTHHRALVVFSGERQWCGSTVELALATMTPVIDSSKVCWVTNQAVSPYQHLLPGQCHQWLGEEFDIGIYDAFAGFNPDAFAIVSGLLKGGGLLILLCPGLCEWHKYSDPDYQSLSVYPYCPDQLTHRFLQRCQDKLLHNKHAVLLEQVAPDDLSFRVSSGGASPLLESAVEKNAVVCKARFAEQQLAVTEILRVATGHRRRPLVITADRGRGKSAALGMAAARLLQQGKSRIVITAPRPDATVSVFKHAAVALECARGKSQIKTATGCIEFIAPDELVRNAYEMDLLMVDEAAAIPTGLLNVLTRKYPRIVFASTTHGYEGAGRGFSLKFQKSLAHIAPQWKHCELTMPIRWGSNDPLENWVNDLLLMDADAAQPGATADCTTDNCQVQQLDRDQLLDNEELLRQIWGLLVAAHYRTTPSDLRDLLDGPNLRIHLLRFDSWVMGACLVADEGRFDESVCEDIVDVRRRPRGHLLPQTLMLDSGDSKLGAMRYVRVVRIAIHPEFQGRGLGSYFLQQIWLTEQASGADIIGSSFAASVEVLNFWRTNDYRVVRLGFSRETSSGLHAALVLRPLSETGAVYAAMAEAKFAKIFRMQLLEQFRELDVDIAISVLCMASCGDKWHPEPNELRQLHSFVEGRLYYDACSVLIWHMCCDQLQQAQQIECLTQLQLAAVILRVMQKKTWVEIADYAGLTGQKAVVTHLRAAIQRWLSFYQKK